MRRYPPRGYDDTGRPVVASLEGPCTRAQWGRVRRECERLGVDDRAARVQLAGALAGRAVESTRQLTAGECGLVGRLLSECRTLADAYALADYPRRARQRARQWAKLRRQLAAVVLAEAGRA